MIEHRQDAEQVKILKSYRKFDRRDWPIEAMLNAFYLSLVLHLSLSEVSAVQLGGNPTLMRVCDFPLEPYINSWVSRDEGGNLVGCRGVPMLRQLCR